MGLLKKTRFGRHSHSSVDDGTYIDLGKLDFDNEGAGVGASMFKVAEIYRYEDIQKLTELVYGGHSLIIDYNAIAHDEPVIKRIFSELKSVARDINGDVAAIGREMIVVTQPGMPIDRAKIKGGF